MRPRLTSAQHSYLTHLNEAGGYARLYKATYRTAVALHDKGMIVVTLVTPVTGQVRITSAGRAALSKGRSDG